MHALPLRFVIPLGLLNQYAESPACKGLQGLFGKYPGSFREANFA